MALFSGQRRTLTVAEYGSRATPKMRDLLITNIRLQKSFNFLTHSLKVSVWPRKILELILWMSQAHPLDLEVLYLVQNGSEQSRGALPSLSTVKDITAHDSGDSGAHTMRKEARGW